MCKYILALLVSLFCILPSLTVAEEIEIDGEAITIANHRSDNNLYMFSAAWCGPCKKMKPLVKALAEDGYKVFIFDIDECKKQKIDISHWQIKKIPTIIINKPAGVDDNGVELFLEVKRFVGEVSKDVLQKALDKDWSDD